MSKKICTRCHKEIEGDYKMVPMEKPYLNLFFHRDCFSEISDELEDFLKNNLSEIIRNYPEKPEKTVRK
jgi:hypothetical protein